MDVISFLLLNIKRFVEDGTAYVCVTIHWGNVGMRGYISPLCGTTLALELLYRVTYLASVQPSFHVASLILDHF